MNDSKRSYRRVAFVFRRDLRLDDNLGLMRALADGGEVLPLFIFDPRQYRDHPYRSGPGLEFMLESLRELADALTAAGGRLHCFEGSPSEVLLKLSQSDSIDAVYFNRDYTPFSRERDRGLHEALQARGIGCRQFADALLNEPERALKPDGSPYSVFTPFYKRSRDIAVPAPVKVPAAARWYVSGAKEAFGPERFADLYTGKTESRVDRGGRSRGLSILQGLDRFSSYKDQRDFPAIAATTRLSPHHKFGTVSIREVFHALQAGLPGGEPLIRQLYWRDFFTHVAFHWPHVFGRAFKPAFDRIEWSHDEAAFARWCEGTTGFPIVDAGMRELRESGYMHNRVRMITASFLTKDLHIDWRWGERHFARHLVDYDPCVNNGSWQWASSTGCDAQPYFRIFNPWLQQVKFDPDAQYIKRWVPELRGVSGGQIHEFESEKPPSGYPSPMLEHAAEKVITEEMFEVVKEPGSAPAD